MIETIHKGRKVTITYRNDVIFKTTLGGNDEISKELLKFVVEAVTGKTYEELTVVNTEMLGKFVLGKKNYLDIRAEDKAGNITNIEMQQSDIAEYDLKRFQNYAYRTVSNGNMTGESYEKLKPVDQIIFTTGKFEEQLVTEYKQRQENGKVMEHNLASFYFISLPYIEEIVREKKERKEKVSNLEMLSYVYHKEIDDDIISVSDERQKRMIELMDKKYQEASVNEEIFDEVKEAAYYETWFDAQLRHYENKGYNNGMIHGIEQGVAQGKIEIIVSYVKNTFNKDITDWINQLDINQLKILEENIFKVKSIEELKQLV